MKVKEIVRSAMFGAMSHLGNCKIKLLTLLRVCARLPITYNLENRLNLYPVATDSNYLTNC